MEIFGREVHFFFSVGAKMRIDHITTTDLLQKTAETAAILSGAYDDRKAFEDPEYKKQPLKVEEVLALTDDEFDKLTDEIAAAFKEGSSTSVEAETSKKKEEKKSS